MDGFRKILWWSAGLHAAFFLLIALSPTFFKLLPERKTKVTWVKLTKGFSDKSSDSPFKKANGLPESTLREQKSKKETTKDKKGTDTKSQQSPIKNAEKKPLIPNTSPNGGINPEAKPQPNDQTIEEALKRVQEELEKRNVEIEAAQVPKEGEGQSPEGSLENTTGETDPVLVAYYTLLKKKINDEWVTTPKQLADGQTPKTQINVMIDSEGKIITAEYELKSGDESFDLSAMRAIEAAAPYPSPPEQIKDEALTEGFLIEFNPKTVVGNP